MKFSSSCLLKPSMATLTLVGQILVTVTGLTVLWWGLSAFEVFPAFILPSPFAVAQTVWSQKKLLAEAGATTALETLLGLVGGIVSGGFLALLMLFSKRIRQWIYPLILISQAIPVYALAPLLVLWFGFGLASKIVMTILVIFFPITSSLYDGLSRTPSEFMALGKTMNATPWALIVHIRLPAALPAFASGVKVAAAIAPIGAVIGEWVGASSGLGFLMQTANTRFDTNLMFAALAVLCFFTLSLWGSVHWCTKKLIPWVSETP